MSADSRDIPPAILGGHGGLPLTRGVARDMANAMISSDLEESQRYLRPFLPEYCEKVIEGCRKLDRTCMTIYAQAMKLIGAQVSLTVNLWQRLGAQDEGHAQRLIQTALDAEGMDVESAWRLSEQFVQQYRREHGLPELVEASSGPPSPERGLVRAELLPDDTKRS